MSVDIQKSNPNRIRKIIHFDLDAFFCAVEELLNPDLIGKPFAVGGAAGSRGVIASCSYPARRFGVRSAMPTGQAIRLCPQLIVVSGHFPAYKKASRLTMDILDDLTPLVEQISIDEAFLDVTDLPQDGKDIAIQIQSAVKTQTGLPSSMGVATNKLVAKIANNMGKSEHRQEGPPLAIKVVPAGEEASFLAPLPVNELWGIGPKTAAHLHRMGIDKVGDIASLPEKWLVDHFGKAGLSLYRHSRGIDDRELSTTHDTKSISNEITFNRDISEEEQLKACLRRLADKVGLRLRKSGMRATTVRIKLRWSDFSTYTRQITLPDPFDQDNLIFEAGWALFVKLWEKGRPVRLLGIGVSNLQSKAIQLSLWETDSDRERRLLTAMDALRERFGNDVITRGTGLHKPDTGRR